MGEQSEFAPTLAIWRPRAPPLEALACWSHGVCSCPPPRRRPHTSVPAPTGRRTSHAALGARAGAAGGCRGRGRDRLPAPHRAHRRRRDHRPADRVRGRGRPSVAPAGARRELGVRR
ncbi:hypothetical protein FC770_06655 [Nocardioides jishulii]|uniref:Uncharacterized protein n=1 Tax=Nocardioides jishulii TaxID=2575440 RepID=A0A4U2YTH8_9ACTN|nr:hypothetical protein FCL41_12920 [Nocardioides jishulii]TKI64787.1 hypothetical protein FC770_06655 [Nocardioides jishulii]